MPKIAFFAHDVGMYGATRSLALTMTAMIDSGVEPDENIHLFYNGKRVRSSVEPSPLFDRIRRRRKCWLPVSKIYFGSPMHSYAAYWWKEVLGRTLLSVIDWLFNYRRHLRDITHVHINAHVMWPLLFLLKRRKRSLSIHIRDLLDFDRFPRSSHFIARAIKRRADHIIAIDRLCAQPFLDSGKVTILTNPFDMEKTYEWRRQCDAIYAKYGLNRDVRYVVLLGQISELKGAARFGELAKAYSDHGDVHFLLVGPNVSEYSHRVVAEFNALPNATYLGETLEVEQIYAIAHVVVRCDAFLPLGRTLWEAYFSGCKVLAPVRPQDDPIEIRHLLDRAIWLYPACDMSAAANVLQRVLEADAPVPHAHGNAIDYARRFHGVITGGARA